MLDDNIYYTTSGIYGVKIYTFINNECKILFEQKQNTPISNEMMEETKIFYKNLDENTKKDVKFQIYRKCNSIEDEENCMIWWNTQLNKFIKDFGM
jgi:hypothetical protein